MHLTFTKLGSTIYECLILPACIKCIYITKLFNIFTGNFGVVYKAWYTRSDGCTRSDIKTKVAIKTLKGN